MNMYRQLTGLWNLKRLAINEPNRCFMVPWSLSLQRQIEKGFNKYIHRPSCCQNYCEEEKRFIVINLHVFVPRNYNRLFSSSTKENKQNSSKNSKNLKDLDDRKDELWKALYEPENSLFGETKSASVKRDVEINEDSLWDATSESQRNRKRKNRKRFKKTSEKQDMNVSEENLWDATAGFKNEFKMNGRTRNMKEKVEDEKVQFEFDGTRNDLDSTIPVTTKKTAKKPPPHAERDKDMLKVIQGVISELGMDQDDGKVAKRDLSQRFKLIQEQKAVTETNDFDLESEAKPNKLTPSKFRDYRLINGLKACYFGICLVSLLKEIKAGSAEESSGGFRWETVHRVQPFVKGEKILRIDVNTTSGERLGFFNKEDFSEEHHSVNSDKKDWSALDWYKHYSAENDDKVSFNPGKHYAWDPYDELISWTEEGKLWKFPIDNEAGMEEEADVPFYEHVFLEDKLNNGNWCPKTGPIRNFMSSVIIALSQNAFLSVKEKHEHIEWFRDYFTERLPMIKKLGLVEG